MKKATFLLFLMLTVLFQACRSPQKLYDKGNFEAAYKVSSKQLEKYKDVESNTRILENSLDKILKIQSAQKETLLRSEDFANRDKVIQINNELIDRIHWVRIFVPKVFAEELEQLEKENVEIKSGIKEDRLEIGKELLTEAQQADDKFKAREAWEQFKVAKSYHRGQDQELDSLITLSAEMAVLVYYVQANQRMAIGSRMELDEVFKNINSEGDQFTKILYKPNDPVELADCLIRVNVGNIKYQQSSSDATKDFTKTIVVGTESTTNDKGETVEVEVTEDITGTVVQTTSTLNAKSDVQIEIKAQNKNCKLSGENFSHEFQDVVENYSSKGDLRAIPDEYKNIRRGEHRKQEELSEIMTQRIYQEVVQRLFKKESQ